MSVTATTPERILVIKVGFHLGEHWEAIVTRKLHEERLHGVVHWGYGGSVCNPFTQVQPFASASSEAVTVFMLRTTSDFHGDPPPANERALSRSVWEPMPSGVRTTGRFALILESLRAADEPLDLGAYEVGVGPKLGTPLTKYLRARVDKACARRASTACEPWIVQPIMRAELVPPFAVALRTISTAK